MEYTHSKDYLIELAIKPQTKGWMRDLIIKIVNHNGVLSNIELIDSLQQLKTNAANVLAIPSATILHKNDNIKLLSLTHHTGVCALAPEQTIEFSKDFTLLYGKNGSGKSSYFRILNEIAGGNHQTALKPNIYLNTNKPINIELIYEYGINKKRLLWDGTDRAISPLTLLSVFDSNYTKTFLQKRSANSAIVLPYGLHLFTALTTAMDNMKSMLQTEIDSKLRTVPRIVTDELSEKVRNMLVHQSYNEDQKRYIQDRFEFSDEQNQELNQIENQLTTIKTTNYDDKIKLCHNEKSEYDALYQHLIKILNDIQEYVCQINQIVKAILKTRSAYEEVKSKIAILNEIGHTDSKEWKSFIEAANLYVTGENINKDVCPYCRQPLINNAVDIIAAYSMYLSDKKYSELNDQLKKKEQLKREISLSPIDYSITEVLKELIYSRIDGTMLYLNILEVFESYAKLKSNLIEALEHEITLEVAIPESVKTTLSSISTICEDYESRMNSIHNERNQKNQLEEKLLKQIKPLIEHRTISKQKDLFIDWFEKIRIAEELKRSQGELSTRGISTLAKTASQKLVTENLKSKFQEELNILGLNYLRVELFNAEVSRGQSFMQLRLVNNNSVIDVLSEGEQKGVALALFIAEQRMQLSHNPIILDDPVNSLDHFITAKFIERLSNLDNQIIIFSHNLLLQTSLINCSSAHLCGKNQVSTCNKKTKHVFLYSVKSHGRDLKGVITEAKQDNITNNLKKVNKLLSENPFTENEQLQTEIILRHTIELMIDEKVFKNQVPVRFQGKKNSIQWDQLRSLNADVKMIDTLKSCYNRLSGGGIHVGVESTENPIDYDELKTIYLQISNYS